MVYWVLHIGSVLHRVQMIWSVMLLGETAVQQYEQVFMSAKVGYGLVYRLHTVRMVQRVQTAWAKVGDELVHRLQTVCMVH